MDDTNDSIHFFLRETALGLGDRRVVDALTRNALRYVDDFRMRHPAVSELELARKALERVLAEAKAHPPCNALCIAIEHRPAVERVETGLWTQDEIALVLHWSNRADFWIELKDLRGCVTVDESAREDTFTLETSSRFEVAPRGEHRLPLIARRDCKHPALRYSHSMVSGEAYVEAVVIGPWVDGSHQVCRFTAGRALVPVARSLVAD